MQAGHGGNCGPRLFEPDDCLVGASPQFVHFPDGPSEYGWAILKAAGAPEADAIAKALQSEYEQVERELSVKLSPLSAATALQAYWGYQAAGQEAKGIEVLKQCAAQGVPLPFEP